MDEFNKELKKNRKICFWVVFVLFLLAGFLFIRYRDLVFLLGRENRINVSGAVRDFLLLQFISLLITLFAFTRLFIFCLRSKIKGSDTGRVPHIHPLFKIGGCFTVGALVFFLSRSLGYFLTLFKLKRGESDSDQPDDKKGWKRLFHISEGKVSFADLFEAQGLIKRGLTSLTFWFLLSIVLILFLWWKASGDGCDFCWDGIMRTPPVVQKVVDVFAVPVRWIGVSAIPGETEIDYLLNNTSGGSGECQCCWLVFLTAVIFVWTMIPRIVFILLYAVLFRFVCSAGQTSKRLVSKQKPQENGSDRGTGYKPGITVDSRLSEANTLEPHLLLACGFKTTLSGSEWRKLLNQPNLGLEILPDLLCEDAETWVKNHGAGVRDAVILIDSTENPTAEFGSWFINQFLMNLSVKTTCYPLLTCGEKLRRQSSGIKPIREKMDDWLNKFKEYQRLARKDGTAEEGVKIVPIDWFDHQWQTETSIAKLSNFFNHEWRGRYGGENPPAEPPSRFPEMADWVRASVRKFSEILEKQSFPITSEEKTQIEDKRNQLTKDAEESLRKIACGTSEGAASYAEKIGTAAACVFDQAKNAGRMVQETKKTVDDLKSGAVITKGLSRGAKTLWGKFAGKKENPEEAAFRSEQVRELARRLTEITLILEYQGNSEPDIAEKLRMELSLFDQFSDFSGEAFEEILNKLERDVALFHSQKS